VLKRQGTPPKLGRDGTVFKDSRGHSIVGIGFDLDRVDARSRLDQANLDYHKLKAGVQVLTDAQMMELLDSEVRQALRDAEDLIKKFDELREEKKRVVADLVFHLGPEQFRKNFRQMVHALEECDYNQAAEELRASDWYDQAGDRGRELVNMMLGSPPVAPLGDKRVRRLKRQSAGHATTAVGKARGGPTAQFGDGRA
jgi:GH24 family phage-related lysozyme (muramidase)